MLDDAAPDLLLRQLGRREVAQVLVQPVRPEARDDALLPPRRRADLALPRPRGVPVVADVVVVEDHRRRHGRQHPADHLLAPRQPVELGVLDEVLDLQARRLVEAAPRGHELLELLVRGRVGVDLVAEQQQHVRPGAPRGRRAGPGPGCAARRRRAPCCPRRRGNRSCGRCRTRSAARGAGRACGCGWAASRVAARRARRRRARCRCRRCRGAARRARRGRSATRAPPPSRRSRCGRPARR